MKVNYTIDLEEYETLFELRRYHCGPSLCIRHTNDGFLINLLLLTNIAFTESSFQVFLEEIERISKLPPHPCIVRFIGLSKPNPNFYNSIGIGYEFCPKCFSLECIIGDILCESEKNKIENLNSKFNTNVKQNDNDKNLTNINSNANDNNDDNETEKQNLKSQLNEVKIAQDIIDSPSLVLKGSNDSFMENVSNDRNISNDNLNISINGDSNYNNGNNNYVSNDNDLKFDSNNNDSDSDHNSNGNDSNFDRSLNSVDLPFDNSTNTNDLSFDDNNNNDNNDHLFINNNNTDISFDDSQNNSSIDFDNSNNSNKKPFNDNNDSSNEFKFDNKEKKDGNDNNNEHSKQEDKSNNSKQGKNTQKKSTENDSILNHEQTLILLYGISNAISFLHQYGITFMNLTISNILLDENLEPKIQYYGISSLFEYFTLCCCNPIGTSAFLKLTSKINLINNYILNYNNIVRNINSNDVFDFDGFRIVSNKSIINIQNRNFLYIIRNLKNEYIDGDDKNDIKSQTYLDRNLKDLIFVSPEVLHGKIPDKKSDVYGFSYLLFFFLAQDRIKWILNFDISFINNILNQNRLVVKNSVPVLVKTMITRSWESNSESRPNMSEISWMIGELGQFIFNYHDCTTFSQRLKKYAKFQNFKEKLPEIKRDKNLFFVRKNTKMLYDTVKQLPISINRQNYAQSVIKLQSLLMSLRNSNLFDTLDAIVLNDIKKGESSVNRKRSQVNKKKGKRKLIFLNYENNNYDEDSNDMNIDNDNDDTVPSSNIKASSGESYNFDSLTDSDYESKIFNQLYFVQTKNGVYSLALNITVACTSRFKKILFYARLVSELYHGYRSKYPCLSKLKKYLLSFFITSLANYCAYPNALPIVSLIFYCLQLHVYDTKEMIDIINDFYEKYKTEKKISISILFCWFCPEIESTSIELFNKMYELVKTQCQYDYFPFAFKDFIEHIDKYRENNWCFYYNLRFDKDLTSFSYVLRKDDLETFSKMCLQSKKLFNSKINPDIFVPCIYAHHYPTAIMYAALFGSSRCCLFLLKNGARTASWDRKYRLLPSYSIAGGDENVFIHCLQSYKEDDSLMQTAVQFHRNYFFYKSYLIDKKLLTSKDKFGKSVMSAAAGSNNVSALIFSFVQKSCRDNFVESFGRTPLHVAAEQEMVDVLRVLLFLANDSYNANIPLQKGAATASMDSSSFSSWNNSSIDSDLHSSNTDLINNNIDSKRNNAKKSKITSKLKSKIVSKFSSNKIQPSNSSSQINTNLDSDDSDYDDENTQSRIEHIVDVNARDSWGMTPLHLAADKIKRKSVEILFTSPYIDVNIKNNSGKTAVYYAVKTGDLKLIKLFLKNPKVDFCCQTKKGQTPLHTAVKMERADIVKLIIDNKPSSMYVPDLQNMSPFEMAVASNTSEIASIFHEYIMKKYEESTHKLSTENDQVSSLFPPENKEDKANKDVYSTETSVNNNNYEDSELKAENFEVKVENDNNNNNDSISDEGDEDVHQIITDEIPNISLDDSDDGDENSRKRKRRKKKKASSNDSEDCAIF